MEINNSFSHSLEAEIVELQRRITEKRNLLEQQNGIIEEAEAVEREVLSSFVSEKLPKQETTSASGQAESVAVLGSSQSTYLDTLDPDLTERINSLIESLPQKGLSRVIAEALNFGPFVVDAFHDALVDKLYAELVARGFVKVK